MNVHKRSLSCEKTEAQNLTRTLRGVKRSGARRPRPQVGQSESSGNLDEEKSSLSASAQVLHDSCTGFPQNDANEGFEPKTDPADRMNALNRMNLDSSAPRMCLPLVSARRVGRAGRHDFPDFHARWQRVRQLRRVREAGRQRHLLDARRWSARSAAPSGGDGQDDLVDWPKTDRYSASARYKRYAETRGEEDYLRLSNEVADVLNTIALTTDRAQALVIAERARVTVAAWPQTHFAYRQDDIRRSSRCSIRRSRRCARSAAEIPSSCRSSQWLALPTSSRCSVCRT